MTIGEVSVATGLSSDTLRYYEKIELIKDVSRTSGGKRDYSEHDLTHIYFINCMKKAGCSLEVIKEYLNLHQVGAATIESRIELLENQKAKLLQARDELQSSIDYLDYKITVNKNELK